MVAVKAAHYDWLYAELDMPEGEKKIYRLSSTRYRATQDIGQVKNIKDENHQILRVSPAILRCWSDYFTKISKKEFTHPPIQSAVPTLGPILLITTKEVK